MVSRTGQPHPVTVEHARADIDEFEFLLSFGMSIERARERLGRHPRTIMRRYQMLGLPYPPGLSAASRTYSEAS